MSDEVEFKDHRGDTWYRYTCSYTDHEGLKYCLDMWARNNQDADLRLEAIKKSMVIDGRVCVVIGEDSGNILVQDGLPQNDGLVH